MLLKRLLPLLLLAALPASATVRTVKAGGGGDFTTIQACATAMAAGDTCTVFAGTYNEAPTLTAGTVGNYKTINVNGSDLVVVQGFNVASHTKITGNCATPGVANLGVCSFSIEHPSAAFGQACIHIPFNTTDVIVSNIVAAYCGGNGVGSEPGMVTGGGLSTTPGTSFIYILNSTFFHGCAAAGVNSVCSIIEVTGDHFFFDGNDFSDSNDWVEFYASFVVVRNTLYHDAFTSHCSLTHSSNCHGDMVETEPTGVTLPSQHTLFEGNQIKNMTVDGGVSGASFHGALFQGDGCGSNCNGVIMRFNLWYKLGGYYMLNNNTGTYNNVKNYNETIAFGASEGDLSGSWTAGGSTAAIKNVLMYQYPISTPGSYFYGTPVVNANSINPATNPFVNANSDWHLTPGAAQIAAGGPLTTAVGAGSSSTTLTVADANYFQDGWGFPNGTGLGQLSPDTIRIGASTIVQISSINYATNVITLASAVSWSNSASVYLYKKSDGTVVLGSGNPDIGAFPVTSTLAPPTNLNAIPIVKPLGDLFF